MTHKQSKATLAFQACNYALLLLTSLVCLLPFVNLLAVSFSGSTAVNAGIVTFWPVDFTTKSYEYALTGGKFLAALWISVKRVGLGLLVNLSLVVLTAYPMSKTAQQLKGRNAYMLFFVFTMIFYGGMIPVYLLVSQLKLLNTLSALVLPGALPVSHMVIMMNFLRGLPAEIEEAATIDGAGPFLVLFRVVLPLMTPALATISLFIIVGHWNDWFNGMLYMQNPTHYPLQTYLQSLLRSFEDIMKLAGNNYAELLQRMNARTGRAAQLFLGALPVMLIYPLLQKHFTTGLVMGSVKG